MNPIDIVLASDSRCVLGTAVSMRSITENCSPDWALRFHVATHRVPLRHRSALEETVLSTGRDVQVTFGSFDPGQVRHLARSKLINHMAYASLFLPDLLPPGTPRCLWVDSDLVFERDVSELWQTSLGGCTLGAVADGNPALMALYQRRLGMATPLYFNSGVLLADLERWRERDITLRAVAAAERIGDDLILHDQDALNVALEGDWLPLPHHWNVWVIWPELSADASAVFHYMGAPKPWHADYDRPFPGHFHRYLDRTPFGGKRPWNPAGMGSMITRFRRRIPSLRGTMRFLRSTLRRRAFP